MLLVLVLMQQLQQAEKLQQQPRQQNANKYVKNLHVCHHLLSAFTPTGKSRARGQQQRATRNRLFNLLHKCFKSHGSNNGYPRLLPLPFGFHFGAAGLKQQEVKKYDCLVIKLQQRGCDSH